MEKPVPVPGPTVYEYVDVPSDFLIQHEKTTIPETLTYGEAIMLWSLDRAIIETQNGQIRAIGSLNEHN